MDQSIIDAFEHGVAQRKALDERLALIGLDARDRDAVNEWVGYTTLHLVGLRQAATDVKKFAEAINAAMASMSQFFKEINADW